VANDQGDYEQAQVYLEESLARFRELGIKWGIAYALGNLGRAALCRGDLARANALIEESMALCRELGDKDSIAECLVRLGGVAIAQGEVERALALYRESLTLYHSVGDRAGVAECLKELGMALFTRMGQSARAARLLGAAEVLREAAQASLVLDECFTYERTVATIRAQLDEAVFAREWGEGRAMTIEQAVACALSA